MRRVDALGPTSGRQHGAVAAVLTDDEDPELQALVERAAAELSAPIALVSLVLDKVQFFRAHCGLPPALARARATRRDESFCQLVVRDETRLVVEDEAHHPHLPQQLIEQYGIRAYAGVPLRLEGAVLGSLCVIDTAPRAFTEVQLAALEKLAARATVRLREIAARERSRALLEQAVEPALAEVHNLLMPLTLGAEDARAEAFELEVSLRVDGARPDHLESLRGLAHRLRGTLDDVVAAATRITAQTRAIQQAMARGQAVSLPALLEVALGLSQHVTRLSGGAEVSGRLPEVHVDGGAIAVVATSLSILSSRSMRPLTVTALVREGSAMLRLAPEGGSDVLTGVVQQIQLLAGPTVGIDVVEGQLELVLDALPAAAQ